MTGELRGVRPRPTQPLPGDVPDGTFGPFPRQQPRSLRLAIVGARNRLVGRAVRRLATWGPMAQYIAGCESYAQQIGYAHGREAQRREHRALQGNTGTLAAAVHLLMNQQGVPRVEIPEAMTRQGLQAFGLRVRPPYDWHGARHVLIERV